MQSGIMQPERLREFAFMAGKIKHDKQLAPEVLRQLEAAMKE